MNNPVIIEISESKQTILSKEQLTEEEAKFIYHNYSNYVKVEWPSPRTGNRWYLTANPVVGQLPVMNNLILAIKPKVPLENLFEMLEFTRTNHFILDFEPALIKTDSIEGFFNILAERFIKGVRTRIRAGLYRCYQKTSDDLNTVRGKINFLSLTRKPVTTLLPCDFEENTSDNIYNRILYAALDILSTSTLASMEVKKNSKQILRTLSTEISTVPILISDIISISYHRLNSDYAELHSLARFFIENVGPSHTAGSKTMLPFIINMPQLFEQYVSLQLKRFLPHPYEVKHQVSKHLAGSITFRFDILIRNRLSGEPVCVLDTKYKDSDNPSSHDVQQIIAYATTLGCKIAGLVYPSPFTKIPFDHLIEKSQIHVKQLTFDLNSIKTALSDLITALALP